MNQKTLLIIGFVWPEPNSSAAGKRMLQLIAYFQELNYRITFVSTASENDYNFELATLGIEKINIQLNSDSFDEILTDLNPEIVVFDRFTTEEQFGWRVFKNCPSALKILDTEDLHCLRLVRGNKLRKNQIFERNDLLTEDITKREIASILRCDLTLIIAEFEMQLLIDFFKINAALLMYLPIIYTEEELFYKSAMGFESKKDFMFIGNFWHEPNWDAVLHLKKEIWPIIRKKLPQAKLKIYGSYASKKVFDLQNVQENFYVLGRAATTQAVFEEARLLLAPLRFGAGIKGKLLDAMYFGTPSVTSSIGAESINGILNWNGFIADSTEDFAAQSIKLYQNEVLWSAARKQGYLILNKRFNSTDFKNLFAECIHNLLKNIDKHRHQNFMGAVLLHHSMRSTEYMAKWIEAKNKK